jgi:hypothetical protein
MASPTRVWSRPGREVSVGMSLRFVKRLEGEEGPESGAGRCELSTETALGGKVFGSGHFTCERDICLRRTANSTPSNET